MSSLRVLVSRAALAACAIGGTAPMLQGGQCELVQLPSYGLAGADDFVRAVCTWDPDGTGPLPENLIAIGSFQQAGPTICSSVAMFDGTSWRPLGSGVDNPGTSQLYSVTSFGGDLIVGGVFESIGGFATRGIARWNGVAWQPMGSELLRASSFAQRGGQLFAVGSFTGTSSASTVASWDGAQWSSISPPINTTGELTVDDSGSLIVAGPLSIDGSPLQQRVARWDGSNWALLGEVFDMDIQCVVAREDEIFVGGYSASPGAPSVPYLRRWDGASWTNAADPIDGVVLALHTHGDDLLIGGTFRNIGGVPATRIARWDGNAFHPLADGLQFGTHKDCATITDFRGGLVAGGEFGQAGDKVVANIALWDGSEWQQMGGDFGLAGTPTRTEETFVNAVGEYQGDVIIGGSLHLVAGSRNIARRTAAGWVGLGSGVMFEVLALAETSQGLLAGGYKSFSTPGPVVDPVALWNGETWESFALESTPNRPIIWDVAEFQGEFIISGELSGASALGEGNLRRWTGAEWLAVGPPTGSIVREMIVHNDELIAGGRFVGPSGEDLRGIAKWNGTHWSPVGNSNDVPMTVTCLAIYNGELHAGGSFNFGDGVSYNFARFDGETWRPIPRAFGSFIESMTAFGGNLFVGGMFARVNGESSPGIARWNADRGAWSSVRISPSEADRFWIFHLHATADELLAAGSLMDTTGAMFGPIVARWTCEPPRPCPGDLDGNSDVNLADLAVMLSHFGEQATSQPQIADIDGDNAVGLTDLALLLRDFGAACE